MTVVDRALQPTTSGEDMVKLLDDSGIEHHSRRIALGSIDKDASLANQARFLSLHDDVVITYAAAMEQGDVFPPIVVNKQKSGKYVVLDGNHRVAAAGLVGFTETTALVTDNIATAQAELFTYAANARHGLPTSTDERVNQALFLVARGNRPKEVARALAIPENSLYRAISLKRNADRIVRVGLKPDHYTDHIVRRLGAIASNTVLLPAADLAHKAKLTSDEVSGLVTEVNKCESERDQLDVVGQWKARYSGRIKSSSGGKVSLPPNVNRIKMLGRIARNIEMTTLPNEVGGLDKAVADDIRRELFESISRLVSVSEAVRA